MAAVAFAPASYCRLCSRRATRLLHLCASANPSQSSSPPPPTPKTRPLFSSSSPPNPLRLLQKRFCTAISSSLPKSDLAEALLKASAVNVPKFQKRLRIVDVKGGPDRGLDSLGTKLLIKGWVRTCRAQSSIAFMEINDGSCLSNMQCVMGPETEAYKQVDSGFITTGTSVCVKGTLVRSQGAKQKVELKVESVTIIGMSDPSAFPIQKKRASREFLRTIAHLRPRTNTFGAVARVRNALAYATHKFFQENGFVWISTPIITASDCEGAGEQFCVTTLIPSSKDGDSLVSTIPAKEGVLDWSQDFFGRQAFLTVSGQLNAETYACSLSDVYTFGPTFRAENSNTSRHLAEFWMIEPELAFADIHDDMACATAYLQYVNVAEKDFVRLTYTDAVELLLNANKKFEFPVRWGCDLQSEHERYITEDVFAGCPVIIRDYPKDIKAFYMRQNDDGKTVAAMDILVPRVGELIGGSQREERLDLLENRLDEMLLSKESYWWYLDLRRFGSVPHSGFGLGFERLVQFVTGLDNIRDVIPFPRTPGSAEF